MALFFLVTVISPATCAAMDCCCDLLELSCFAPWDNHNPAKHKELSPTQQIKALQLAPPIQKVRAGLTSAGYQAVDCQLFLQTQVSKFTVTTGMTGTIILFFWPLC